MAKFGIGAILNGVKEVIRDTQTWLADEPARIQAEKREMLQSMARALTRRPPLNKGNQPPYPIWTRGQGRVMQSGVVNPVSQQFSGGDGATFTIEVSRRTDNVIGRMRSEVTYAGYVIDDQIRPVWMREYGWPSIQQVEQRYGVSADIQVLPETGEYGNIINRVASRLQKIFSRSD